MPHMYASPGAYNVTLTVTEQSGQSNDTTKVVVVENPEVDDTPVVGFNWKLPTRKGQGVEFINNTVDDNGLFTTVWEFGA